MWQYWKKTIGRGNDPFSVYPRLYREFIQCIEHDLPSPVTVRDGARVNLVLEAVQESIETGLPIDIMSLLKRHGIDAEIAQQMI
jgi:predicted dehydrogenase